MKSSRAWIVWLSLALCAVMVFGAMAWLTRNVLAANREQATAEQEREAAEARADLEERTRLALWRLDALGAATALRESSHPAIHYEVLTNSPFLTSNDPDVLLHFQIKQGGGLTSPELDEHNAMERGVAASVIKERKARMKRLRKLLAANPLPGDEWAQLNCAAEVGEVSWKAVPKDATAGQISNKFKRMTQKGGKNRRDTTYQRDNSVNEYVQRAKALALNYANVKQQRLGQQAASAPQTDQQMKQQAARIADDPEAPHSPPSQTVGSGEVVEIGQMRGVWLAGELFLLRQVIRKPPVKSGQGFGGSPGETHKSVQGVWMNSEVLGSFLIKEITDLLPEATLVPARGEQIEKNPLTMASFPFLLKRNEVISLAEIPVNTTLGAPLRVGWAAVALAVLATSLLVRGIMRLSERRASFVSAVTHELRTPLTTFRLYSDMLASGVVKKEKRGNYLSVLSREADRLTHLVENVLAFSRIERGNARSNIREARSGELLERCRERLEARLSTSGLALEMDDSSPLRVRVDSAAVEHILFNLIDNAAKYAAASDPPVVEIATKQVGRFVAISVRDHGPGIQMVEQGRIFRPFHKSAREAAESQPGVGLGLALSRRLAKAQGGDLNCADCDDGALFILRLPLAP